MKRDDTDLCTRWLLFFWILLTSSSDPFHNVRSFGARGDGTSKDTVPVQAAIDAAEKQGGGIVQFPPGNYLCGTIHLKSNVTLNLASGATLLASRDEADFDPPEKLAYHSYADKETTYFHYGLLTGESVHDVAIVGRGTIDGHRNSRGGPKPVAFKNCQHLSLRDITVKNAPNYAISLLGCDYVDVNGVTILNGYADGIDTDCCRHVRISNCYVDTWDDAICLKTSPALGKRQPTENVTVTNCVLSTSSNDLKLGTESSGDFKNIAISNCTLFRRAADATRDLAGLAIESVDGATINGLVVSNLAMQDIYCPIFIRLGNRGRAEQIPRPGAVENVSITQIVATGSALTSSITGLPGYPVKQISLENIVLHMKGGGQQIKGLDVPEADSSYPESTMFGSLPAYALYVRHAEGLTLNNLRVSWNDPDLRPALVFDDIRDLELVGLNVATLTANEPVVWLHQVIGALLQGCKLGGDAQQFLRLSGAASRGVMLASNDLTRVARAVERAPEVPESAVLMVGNGLYFSGEADILNAPDAKNVRKRN